ncbi:MAG TPA: hypothetical protein PJ990_03205 [Saprospiraceae bacterium]|nr:hypothetical protein [Saprospiraceae bacterium]
MNTVSTALFGNYRNGAYLQFMKNVVAIYGIYDTNVLLLQARLQTLADATTALDDVFMSVFQKPRIWITILQMDKCNLNG